VEPEGIGRETVENVIVPAGQLTHPESLASGSVAGGPRFTAGLRSRDGQPTCPDHREGSTSFSRCPLGCGEQNMILFAPDAFILKYLQGTRQLKPRSRPRLRCSWSRDYQRELTYRHDDGSFSAFGEQDESGSLWLTAFVLKTFAQAKELTFIDEAVLSEAADWITSHQQVDGSFESVGFVHHSDMMGGGKRKGHADCLRCHRPHGGWLRFAGRQGRLVPRKAPFQDHRRLQLGVDHLRAGGSRRARAPARPWPR